MSTAKAKEARLNFRLPTELKELIEAAAAAQGQSVSDYALATLIKDAQTVLEESQTTILSARDRKVFTALLDSNAKPNKALRKAAERYKQRFK